MIDLGPPPLVFPIPTIIRPVEGGLWGALDREMARLGLSRGQRRAVLAELRRTVGTRDQKAAARALGDWTGLPLLGAGLATKLRMVAGEAAGGGAFEYIGADVVSGDSNTVAWPAGTQAGDVAILWTTGNGYPTWSNHSGWTTDFHAVLGNANLSDVSSKVLASGDITTPPGFTGVTLGGYGVAIYRGPTAITFKNSVTGYAVSSLTITGFTKSGGCKGVVTIVCTRTDAAMTATQPSGFTSRYEEKITYFDWAFADATPANYSDSASMQWTTLNGSYNKGAIAWELTG